MAVSDRFDNQMMNIKYMKQYIILTCYKKTCLPIVVKHTFPFILETLIRIL